MSQRAPQCRSFFSCVHLDRLGRGHRSFRGPDDLEICGRRAGGQLRDLWCGTEAGREPTLGHCRESRPSDAVSEICGVASVGLLLISGAVWVYRGIVAVNGGRTP